MSADRGALGRLIRTRPDFRRLWYSNMISLVGDWLSYVAVSLVAVDKGESAVSVGMVLVAHTLPMALLGPLAGTLADRFDRRRLMIGAQIGASLLTLAMCAAVAAEAILFMQLFLLLRVGLSGIALTARMAAVPQLVEPDELHPANALMGLTWSVMFTAGVALGGVIAAWFGPVEAIMVDAGTFLLSAVVIARLPALPPPPSDEAPSRPGLRDILVGWTYARPRPRLFAALLAKTPPSVANAAGWVTLNLVAGPRMAGPTAMALGVMHALRAIGTGVGPLLPARWIPREANLGTPLAFVGLALFLAFDSPWVFLPALVLWGMGSGHNWVTSTAELQARTPGGILGRMSALSLMTLQGGQAAMALAAGLLIDLTDDAALGGWVGLGLGVAAWAVLMVIRRQGSPLEGETEVGA